MPFARRRPLLRAAAVGGGAYLAGKRTAQRQAGQQAQEQQPVGTQPSQAVPAPRTADEQVPPAMMAEQLKQLGDLHSSGALSDEEFATAKSKLLGT